jgi:hypothetical protein
MLGFRNHSIAGKLARLNVMVSGTALLLACAGFFLYDYYSFRAELVRNLGVQAQIIGSNSISALVFEDPRAAEKTLSALKSEPHIMLAEIHSPDGRVFASYNRDPMNTWHGPVSMPSKRGELHGLRITGCSYCGRLASKGRDSGPFASWLTWEQ